VSLVAGCVVGFTLARTVANLPTAPNGCHLERRAALRGHLLIAVLRVPVYERLRSRAQMLSRAPPYLPRRAN
jgi:hypothetical protein